MAGYRLADEVPGAGNGYKLVQFTAASLPGSSGGVVIDARGRAIALIVGSLAGGEKPNIGVPLENVLGLAESPRTKIFSSGSAIAVASQNGHEQEIRTQHAPAPDAPEQSDLLKSTKDPEFILLNFKTSSSMRKGRTSSAAIK